MLLATHHCRPKTIFSLGQNIAIPISHQKHQIYIVFKSWSVAFIITTILLNNISISFWSIPSSAVHSRPLSPFYFIWSTLVLSVQFGPLLVHFIYFYDALGAEICVKNWATSLTIILHSQRNISKFLVKLHFFYITKILNCFFPNRSDGFTYICLFFRPFNTYRG